MPAPAAAVEIFEDLAQLTRRAAEIFVEASNRAVAQRERFTVVLSGGRTPQPHPADPQPGAGGQVQRSGAWLGGKKKKTKISLKHPKIFGR